MALDVRIISGGSTYYLVNSSGSPTAGGSATGASTTPYSLEAADWTPTAAQRQTIYAGGPPFRVGSSPLYNGYGNVTQTFGVGILASSADNMAALIRQLRQILNTALYSTPALLYWQPHNATSPVYFEIYSGDVQEVGDWNNPAAGFTQALVKVTVTQSAVGGRLSAGETLLNAVTFGNTGTGATDNVQSLGSGLTGDLVYEGQAMNVQMSLGAVTVLTSVMAAVVTSRIYDATVAGVISPAGGGGVTSGGGFSVTLPVPPLRGTSLRVLCKVNGSGATSFPQIRFQASTNAATGSPLLTGQWVTVSNNIVYDLGAIPLSTFRAARGVTSNIPRIRLQARSTDSSGATVTVSYAEALIAYTFASYQFPSFGASAGELHILDGFPEQSGYAALPGSPRGLVVRSDGRITAQAQARGTAPRYFPGSSLYLVWQGSTHSTFWTATVTATQAPAYLTLRGNG